MSAPARVHVILCEGFDDRSFWSGWLRSLGCSDPTERGKKRIPDAFGRALTKGTFLFRTSAGSDLLVKPFGGRANAQAAARETLGKKQPFLPARVILNVDDDAEGDADGGAEAQIRGIVRDLDAAVDGPTPWDVHGSVLYPVIWKTAESETPPGVPEKQTLERLVCAAIRAAYPQRGPAVESWLEAEPLDAKGAKNFGYSYLAKWYAEHGAADFFEGLWRDEAVVRELKQRLVATGAWAAVEAVVRD